MHSPTAYDASFTPAAVAGFRAEARRVAAQLSSAGAAPGVHAERTSVEVPRSFLGIRRAPTGYVDLFPGRAGAGLRDLAVRGARSGALPT